MIKLPDDAREILDKKGFAHVATLMPDGCPQITPMWVDREDDLLVLNTAEGRLKLANMRRDARVAVCVQDPDDAYTYLSVRGCVVDITSSSAETHADRLATKYLGLGTFPRDRESDRSRVLVRVEPRRVVVVSDA